MKFNLKKIFIMFVFSFSAYSEEINNPDGHTDKVEHSAGLFIEPMLTYERSESTVNYPAPFANSTGKVDGFGLGARLGMHINEIIFLGLDGRYSMPTFKDANYDTKAISANWGPVAGIQMPNWGMRLWGVIILGGSLNPDSSNGFDLKFKDTSGYRIGTGFRLLPISLNLEYQHLNFGETLLEQRGLYSTTTTFSNVNLVNNSWIASVSIPLAL